MVIADADLLGFCRNIPGRVYRAGACWRQGVWYEIRRRLRLAKRSSADIGHAPSAALPTFRCRHHYIFAARTAALCRLVMWRIFRRAVAPHGIIHAGTLIGAFAIGHGLHGAVIMSDDR